MFTKKKIFISYKRDIAPDEPLALKVFAELNKHYDVFIDQTMLVGTKWAKQIEKQLRKSDYLISFISEHSVNSEMVRAEIETSHRLFKKYGKPVILPVRVKYTEQLVYPLSAYLNPINYYLWEKDGDSSDLIKQLHLAINGQVLSSSKPLRKARRSNNKLTEPSPSVTPAVLESPEGTMDPDSKFYIERASDKIALNAIKHGGTTITIKGPRQMGKSSLLNKIIKRTSKLNRKVIYLDFQLVEESTLSNENAFYKQFCRLLTRELGISDNVDKYWSESFGNPQLCTHYVKENILQPLGQPLVIAIDEVEKVFETKFRSDFFSMLRSWHNNRAIYSDSIWKNLSLVLVTSTEPYEFIDKLNQSPFNVGEVLELEDFTFLQVKELNRRHGVPFSPPQESHLFELLGGHPYLTRKALFLVASKRLSVKTMFESATAERGPFGDHLRYHWYRLNESKDLLSGLGQIVNNQKCDEKIFFRLRGAGLIRRENNIITLRNKLYDDYFSMHLK